MKQGMQLDTAPQPHRTRTDATTLRVGSSRRSPRRSWHQGCRSPLRPQPLAWRVVRPGWQAAAYPQVRGPLPAPSPGGQALLQALRVQLPRLAWQQQAAAGRAQVLVCASAPAEQSKHHVQPCKTMQQCKRKVMDTAPCDADGHAPTHTSADASAVAVGAAGLICAAAVVVGGDFGGGFETAARSFSCSSMRRSSVVEPNLACLGSCITAEGSTCASSIARLGKAVDNDVAASPCAALPWTSVVQMQLASAVPMMLACCAVLISSRSAHMTCTYATKVKTHFCREMNALSGVCSCSGHKPTPNGLASANVGRLGAGESGPELWASRCPSPALANNFGAALAVRACAVD